MDKATPLLEGGDYSFDFYMETKHVSLARGTHGI